MAANIPEVLVDKITLMAYTLSPHPTATIIKPLDKWNGHILWYKFHLKSPYINNINKKLKWRYSTYLNYFDIEITDEEALDKFLESSIYYKMSMKISQDIMSNEDYILSIKCDNIQNGLGNDNPDIHYTDIFIQDHLYNIDYNMKLRSSSY